MTKLIHPRLPLGVLLIAGFYLFGAGMLMISLFTNPVAVSRSIADAHGLTSVADTVILPIVAGIALLIAYGLLAGARWGYYLTLSYLVIFGGISLFLMARSMEQPYIGNSTWSILVLIYLVWKRNYFLS